MRAKRWLGWACVVAMSGCSDAETSEDGTRSERALDEIRTSWLEQLEDERAIAAVDPSYLPRVGPDGIAIVAGGARATLSDAARIEAGARSFSMRVRAIGRRDVLEPAVDAPFSVTGPEVCADRGGGALEWWRALPSGIEHGVTLEERPSGTGPLVIELALGEGASARALTDDAVEITHGEVVLRYDRLVAIDAAGATAPARMIADGARILMQVNDAEARYPLVVDPLLYMVEDGMLAPETGANEALGRTVAIDATGARVMVTSGADGSDDTNSIWFYSRAGASYSFDGRFTHSSPFGRSRMIGDGTRAIVSGGVSARILVRSGSGWSTELWPWWPGSTTSPGGPIGGVAISEDGSWAAMGAVERYTYSGAIYVRTRGGSGWGPDSEIWRGSSFEYWGTELAMDGTGTRILFSSTARASDSGGARVLVRSGTTWTEEAFLAPASLAPNDRFGRGVDISDDGLTAIVGAPGVDTALGADVGRVWIFVRSGTTWTEQATIDGLGAGDGFGSAVSLDAAGTRALVGAPSDDTAAGADAGSVHLLVRSGTTWSNEALLLHASPAAGDRFGSSVALSADGTRGIAGAHRDDTTATDTGSARVFAVLPGRANGETCSSGSLCLSGHCVDGVCCDRACGGGVTTDCEACTAALTGGADGTCGNVAASAAHVCRSSAGACDVADVCDGSGPACPPNARRPAGTVCRASAAACDAVETCTGTSDACPPNVVSPAGEVCRPAAGLCDQEERCDGSSSACPSDSLVVGGTTCRPSSGPCDVVDRCSGTSPICPDDFAPIGTLCRTALGECDAPDYCTGSSGSCPDTVLLAGTRCRASLGPCDVEEQCDGVMATCPADRYATAGTICAPASSAPCDAPDVCAGTSADCVPTYVSGVVCRPAAGACDVAEVCTGASELCPPDAVLAAGIECGGATGSTCSTPGTCNGTSATCPGASPLPVGTVCLPRDPAVPCDVDDVCDGVSDACQPAYRPAGHVCAESGGDVCDAPDVCAGTSADCVPTFLTDVVCRPALGVCDVEETCSGDAPSCPPDGVLAAGVSCRGSSVACDPEEVCDGVATSCPADVSGCADAGAEEDGGSGTDGGVVAIDGGRDAGSRRDASSADADPDGDAGLPPPAAGCACRATSPAPTPTLALLILVGAAVLGARRSR